MKTARHPRRLGAIAAAVGALVGCGLSASPATAAVQKAFWGPTTVNGQSAFPIYRDLGVKTFQMAVSWPAAAPTRPRNARDPRDPAYAWSPDVDFAIREARRHGMRVALMLVSTPGWANGGKARQYAPDRPQDFAEFARAAARRYPTVRQWMIWGEPSRQANFMPLTPQGSLGKALTRKQAEAPRRYSRLLDAAYGQLKRQNPRNLVVGGNTFTTGDIRPVRWIQNMKLPNGRPPRMDLFGHNPFSYRGPDLEKAPPGQEIVDFSELGRFSKKVDQYLARPRDKRHLRLYLSEWTIPTDAPDLEFNFYVTRPLQARWIRDGFKVARELNAYALGWIHLYDGVPRADGGPIIRGGLMTADGQKKPGYFAFKRAKGS